MHCYYYIFLVLDSEDKIESLTEKQGHITTNMSNKRKAQDRSILNEVCTKQMKTESIDLIVIEREDCGSDYDQNFNPGLSDKQICSLNSLSSCKTENYIKPKLKYKLKSSNKQSPTINNLSVTHNENVADLPTNLIEESNYIKPKLTYKLKSPNKQSPTINNLSVTHSENVVDLPTSLIEESNNFNITSSDELFGPGLSNSNFNEVLKVIEIEPKVENTKYYDCNSFNPIILDIQMWIGSGKP